MKRGALGIAAALILASCGSNGASSSSAPVRSSGCGAAARAVTGGEHKVTITSSNAARWYLRHIPAAHDGIHPVPLVLDFHGYQEGAQIHTAMSGLESFGERQGFITVTPQGSGPVPNWNINASSADMVFVGDLLSDVERTTCVDTRRVFVTGLSNGAMMASSVACTYSSRVAAVAPVAGVTAIEPCSLARPVPLIAFHGTNDPFLAYEGGLGPKVGDLLAPDGSGKTMRQEGLTDQATKGPSVPQVMATWASRDRCRTTPAVHPVATDVTSLSFPCPSGVSVELYRVEGGGHTWPGSAFSASIAPIVGHTTMSISADALMWAFFQAHPLKGTPPK